MAPNSGRRFGRPCRRRLLPLLALLGAAATREAAAELVPPGLLEMDVVLAPDAPYHIKVGVGQAKFVRFSCMGGPADVVVSLSTYSERADPLLFLSLDPTQPPSFLDHDGSSFRQWREDSSGDHYAVARGVGPRGGIVGLANVRHFASEELDAVLSLRCTFIVAFDTLFWDHLHSNSACPIGAPTSTSSGSVAQPDGFCSGHGKCVQHGVCDCDGDHAGPACEHSKSDMVVAAEGTYSFNLLTGRYQYFRVRVPPRFDGGYLEVKVTSLAPLVLLIRSDDLPTKGNFELSNFDDWVNQQNVTALKFPVPASDVFGGLAGSYGFGRGRRLEEAAEVAGSGDFRRLQAPGFGDIQCPELKPSMQNPGCQSPAFGECKDSCVRCFGCVKGGEDDRGCSDACAACTSPGCVESLAACAGEESCQGPMQSDCEVGCGSCMACLDSSDRECVGCSCCAACLPIAAKCNGIENRPAENNRFIFVGVYNHRRYFNERDEVRAFAEISLRSEPDFQRADLPSSWLADLYDPFKDVRSLEFSQQEAYAEGDQFLYNANVGRGEVAHLQVRLYRDRMTLIHVENTAQAQKMVLQFSTGPNVSHVLASSRAVPKTLFDFDQVRTQVGGEVEIVANGEPSIWCALFAASGGYLEVMARTASDSPSAPVPVGFAAVCIFGLVCGVVVLGCIQGSVQKIGERMGMDTSVPLSQRFVSLVRSQRPYESTASLTRATSLQGYVGSDVIDRSVEDQYLHRGGLGDDGI